MIFFPFRLGGIQRDFLRFQPNSLCPDTIPWISRLWSQRGWDPELGVGPQAADQVGQGNLVQGWYPGRATSRRSPGAPWWPQSRVSEAPGGAGWEPPTPPRTRAVSRDLLPFPPWFGDSGRGGGRAVTAKFGPSSVFPPSATPDSPRQPGHLRGRFQRGGKSWRRWRGWSPGRAGRGESCGGGCRRETGKGKRQRGWWGNFGS